MTSDYPAHRLAAGSNRLDVAAFLVTLDDRLRALERPLDMIDAALAMIGEHLLVNRVGFVEIEHHTGMIHYALGWGDGVLEPLSGRQSIVEQLGEKYMAHYNAGLTSYARDTDNDALAVPGTLSGVGAKAMMAAPLIRGEAWVAGLFVNHAVVRDWLPEEGALLEGAVRRLWESIERARSEYALAESSNEHDMIWNLSWDMLGVAGPDGIWDSVNPAWTKTLGWNARDIVGRTSDWMEAEEERGRFTAKLSAVAETRLPSEMRHSLRHRDGSMVPLILRIAVNNDRVFLVGKHEC